MNGLKAEFSSRNMKKVTLRTVGMLQEVVQQNDTVLDIGCGNGYVCWQIAEHKLCADVIGIDFVDIRKAPVQRFMLWDGHRIPLDDKSVDIAMLSFVLHHLPNSLKPGLLEEARRVSRRSIFILEDTPINSVDRWFNDRHGRQYRQYIGKDEIEYGFYSKEVWEELFHSMGFGLQVSRRLGRFSRQWRHPFARSVFVIGV